MYIYDETTGKKGSNERVSHLKHYINYYLSEQIKILYLFSACCAGQKELLLAQFKNRVTASCRFL